MRCAFHIGSFSFNLQKELFWTAHLVQLTYASITCLLCESDSELIIEFRPKDLGIASRGSKKICIRESVGMNYPQFVRYLEALHESGLLIEESGLWRTTKKGLIFVVACEKCCSLLNDSNAQRSPPSPGSQKQFRTMRHQT